MITLGPTHTAARNQASLDSAKVGGAPYIEFYDDPRPGNGVASVGNTLAIVTFDASFGTTDGTAISVTVPVESQILVTGTPLWGRIFRGDGQQWADVDVSDTPGNVEIVVSTLQWFQGGFARIISGTFTEP